MVNRPWEKMVFRAKPNTKDLEDVLAMKGVNVHLYGKRFTKPFRKMGHVTIIADTLE